jgi:hypothetical protein
VLRTLSGGDGAGWIGSVGAVALGGRSGGSINASGVASAGAGRPWIGSAVPPWYGAFEGARTRCDGPTIRPGRLWAAARVRRRCAFGGSRCSSGDGPTGPCVLVSAFQSGQAGKAEQT